MLARLLSDRLGEGEIRFYHAGLERGRRRRSRNGSLPPSGHPVLDLRLRHGRRQEEHPQRHPLRGAELGRGLPAGGGPRRPRRLILPRSPFIGTGRRRQGETGEGRASPFALPLPARLCVLGRKAAGGMASSTSSDRPAKAALPVRAAIDARAEGRALARERPSCGISPRPMPAALRARRPWTCLGGRLAPREPPRCALWGAMAGWEAKDAARPWKRPYARG